MQDQLYVQICERHRATAARSEMYRALSALFVYPGSGSTPDRVSGEEVMVIRRAAADLPYVLPAIEPLCAALEELMDTEDIAKTFTRLFDNCTGRPALSLHEKDHIPRDPQMIWEDLIRFYEYFGIQYQLGVNKEWPDWIGMELEFMHYLTFLEISADERAAAGFIAAQTDFLARHLNLWIPEFSDRLSEKGKGTPYVAFAEALAQFISADMYFNQARRTAPLQAA